MRPRLLLADDSVTIQRVIELTFADENVEVVAVGDGKAAIAHVQSQPPDIVLADVGMPERDGYEVAEFIKSTPQLSHIPVLLLTGAFEPVDDARARKIGCDGVLVKPFEPQMVISRVRELLSGAHAPVGHPAAPASPAGVAAADFDRLEPAASPAPAADALEDYFDRLDAALANLGTAPPAEPEPAEMPHPPEPGPSQQPAPPAVPADVSAWNPDLAQPSAPSRAPATEPPASMRPQAPPAAAPTATPIEMVGDLPRGPIPPLHAAFAALLAAEQGEPATATLPEPAPITDEAMEEIVTRVLARMGDDRMRALVLDTAERLVKEEIERIKRG